ncbi:hypothetical protein Lal_00043350 [Lupinus albus]|nr:hypothetical protein Lal_00043350 [Lupinus albus]
MRAFQEQGALGLILELEQRYAWLKEEEKRARILPKNLLAQMLEVLQGMNENLRNLNRSVAPSPDSLSQAGSET